MATNQQSRGVPSFVAGLAGPKRDAAPASPAAAALDARFGAATREPAPQGGTGDEAPVEPAMMAEPEPTPSRPSPAARRRPKAVVAAAEQGSKRGLYLSDAVWDRLVLEARHKKSTASAVAEAILGKSLPKFTVSREG